MLHQPYSAANFAAAPAPAPRTVPTGRRRSSCDFCTKRKRKCDGDGVNRCSFCIAKNQPVCHYSVRLLTGPRADSVSKRASKGPGSSRTGGGDGGAGGADGGGFVSTGDRCSAVVPLKRARLSPSPATGLVGLRENAFIGEFFRTMGFLPFTTESFIRKAMVSTMFRTLQERNPGIPGYSGAFYDDGEEKDGLGGGAMVPSARGRSGVWSGGEDGFVTESKIESAAAACILWSTVGVGCLVGGRPKSSVEGYANLAREALTVCFDDGSVQTARAFTAMSLFQSFLGNTDLSKKYTQFAESIMSALPPGEVPADLSDSHLFAKSCDMGQEQFDEDGIREAATTVANGYDSCTSMVADPRIFQRAELCRWLLKTDIRMSACFRMDMYQQVAFNENRSAPLPAAFSCVKPSIISPQDAMHDRGVEEENNTARSICGFGFNNFEDASQPPPPGEMSQKFAADVSPECQLLETAMQSPNVRGGVGELSFRGIMAYSAVLQGQRDCAVDCLLQCAEIFTRSPGLCRFQAWTHLAHCVLACMVLSEFDGKYEELRNVYNSVIDDGDEGSRRVPPMGEWRGMTSICDHVFCRSLYSFLTTPSAPAEEPPGSSEAVPLTPTSIDEDVDTKMMSTSSDMDTSVSSSASDVSWAKGIFDGRRQQPAEPGGAEGTVPLAPPVPTAARVGSAEAAPTTYSAAGFVAAFGAGAVPVAQQTAAMELGAVPGFGPGAGSHAVSIATESCNGSGSSGGLGLVEGGAGGKAAAVAAAVAVPVTSPAGAAAAAAPSPSAEAAANRALEKAAPLPLLPSVPSPSSSLQQLNNAAESNNSASGEKEGEVTGEVALLDSSEVDGAIDALLGEGLLEGFGEEVSGEEDLLPYLTEMLGEG